MLDSILQRKYAEVEAARSRRPLSTLEVLSAEQEPARGWAAALTPRDEGRACIIAECQERASPKQGLLTSADDPASRAAAYERGGAAAVSVLTDPAFFGGRLEHLRQVREATRHLPVLRTDLIIDEYQIYETRAYGGDAYLLLASVLDRAELQYLTELGRELGMEPLVECQSTNELATALATDARVIGIHSRSLASFAASLTRCCDLLAELACKHPDRIFVWQSDLVSRQDIAMMTQVGYKAFLVGEALMRQDDSEQAVRALVERR